MSEQMSGYYGLCQAQREHKLDVFGAQKLLKQMVESGAATWWLELSNGYKVDKINLVAFSKNYGPTGKSMPAGVSAEDIGQAAKLLRVLI